MLIKATKIIGELTGGMQANNILKKHFKRVTLLHATFFTFAKESEGLKEKGTRWFLNFLGSVQNVIFGFFAVEKFIKFSFRVLEIFKISRKSTCKIQIALRLNRGS